MSPIHWTATLLALGLAAYLIFAMLFPERFS